MTKAENLSQATFSGKRRKVGETIYNVAKLMISNPGMCVKDFSNELNCSKETTRVAINKLIKEPKAWAARLGLSESELILALIIRSGVIDARKKARKAKIKIIKDMKSRVLVRGKWKWRGKANWPASIAAKNKSISPVRAALWCGQEYDFQSPGLYMFNESRAGERPGDMRKFLRF